MARNDQPPEAELRDHEIRSTVRRIFRRAGSRDAWPAGAVAILGALDRVYEAVLEPGAELINSGTDDALAAIQRLRDFVDEVERVGMRCLTDLEQAQKRAQLLPRRAPPLETIFLRDAGETQAPPRPVAGAPRTRAQKPALAPELLFLRGDAPEERGEAPPALDLRKHLAAFKDDPDALSVLLAAMLVDAGIEADSLFDLGIDDGELALLPYCDADDLAEHISELLDDADIDDLCDDEVPQSGHL